MRARSPVMVITLACAREVTTERSASRPVALQEVLRLPVELGLVLGHGILGEVEPRPGRASGTRARATRKARKSLSLGRRSHRWRRWETRPARRAGSGYRRSSTCTLAHGDEFQLALSLRQVVAVEAALGARRALAGAALRQDTRPAPTPAAMATNTPATIRNSLLGMMIAKATMPRLPEDGQDHLHERPCPLASQTGRGGDDDRLAPDRRREGAGRAMKGPALVGGVVRPEAHEMEISPRLHATPTGVTSRMIQRPR